jgi:prenyl protein peptidase
MDTSRIVVVAPIFFGSAHLHHAISRWHQAPLRTILLQTVVQFMYTSVFGAYSAYIYLRTGSVVAIVLSHAFCNGMGLPDLDFARPDLDFARPFSSLYAHRYILGMAHLGGIVCFQKGFHSDWLLPNYRISQ